MSLADGWRALLEGSRPWALVPLALVTSALLALVLERVLFLGGFPGTRLPRLSRRGGRGEDGVKQALGAYLEEPGPEREQALLTECAAHPSPYARFIARVFPQRDKAPPRPELRELELEEAELQGELEIERGLDLVPTLGRAAILLGLLGVVLGLGEVLHAWTVLGTADAQAWASGVATAALAAQSGLAVALVAALSGGWLRWRARLLREDIRIASRLLIELGPLEERSAAQ